MDKQELIQLGKMIIERTFKDIGHVMSDIEIYEYWQMLIDKTFKPIEYNAESCSETYQRLNERNNLSPLGKLMIKIIAQVCFTDLLRERKEKEIDYADHRDIYSIVASMLFYECFKEKKGDEWPGLYDIDLLKASLRVVRSLR